MEWVYYVNWILKIFKPEFVKALPFVWECALVQKCALPNFVVQLPRKRCKQSICILEFHSYQCPPEKFRSAFVLDDSSLANFVLEWQTDSWSPIGWPCCFSAAEPRTPDVQCPRVTQMWRIVRSGGESAWQRLVRKAKSPPKCCAQVHHVV